MTGSGYHDGDEAMPIAWAQMLRDAESPTATPNFVSATLARLQVAVTLTASDAARDIAEDNRRHAEAMADRQEAFSKDMDNKEEKRASAALAASKAAASSADKHTTVLIVATFVLALATLGLIAATLIDKLG